jgi:hypothetical protein
MFYGQTQTTHLCTAYLTVRGARGDETGGCIFTYSNLVLLYPQRCCQWSSEDNGFQTHCFPCRPALPSLVHPTLIPSYDEFELNSRSSCSRHRLSFGVHRDCLRLLLRKSRRPWHAPIQVTTSASQTSRAHSWCANSAVERNPPFAFRGTPDVVPRVFQVMVSVQTLPSPQMLHKSCQVYRSVSRPI